MYPDSAKLRKATQQLCRNMRLTTRFHPKTQPICKEYNNDTDPIFTRLD
jgi:hypothetical protein